AVSNAETRVRYGHPEPMLLDRMSHRLRPGHSRFVTPATPSDTTGQPRVPDPNLPCSVAVPSTSVSNAPDGGSTDGGSTDCTSSPTLPGLFAETVPDNLFTSD